MGKVVKSRVIHAPADQVWQVIGNYNQVQVFHPFVQSADQLSEESCGLGATRRCNLYNGSSVVEKIIEWKEGSSFTVQATASSPFKEVMGGMHVESIDANTSKVTVNTSYKTKWGPVGMLMDLFMLRMGMNYALNNVLKGLQHHVETGETIGKGGRPIPLQLQSATSKR